MIRIALCQINTTVGDLEGNLERIKDAAGQAALLDADLALFPELTIAGYPPEDLLLKPRFSKDCRELIFDHPPQLPLPALIGSPWRDPESGNLYNAAALIAGGEVKEIYRKNLLPNYAVFDEKRYFTPGHEGLVVDFNGTHLGVVICEDAWEEDTPALNEAAAGAQAILCLSASPFHRRKHETRHDTFARLCRNCNTPLIYCNLVGGQDELVFDGGSLYMDRDGKVLLRGPEFGEEVFCIDLDVGESNPHREVISNRPVRTVAVQAGKEEHKDYTPPQHEKLSQLAEVYDCLVLGVGDYVRKNGFSKVVIGLSGGIDSALAAAVAVDALGKENVTGVTMPSRYSSEATKSDAQKLAENLGIAFHTIPIGSAFGAFSAELEPLFNNHEIDITEENLQARIRAVYLMALSNKFGWLVLNTSNKSEAAVGYSTMYGDAIGAYSVLKDVFKTMVFELSRFVNERHRREVIPESTITRPPSAELRPDQKDSDSLPDYKVLDPVLEAYIEKDMGKDEMVAMGFAAEVVERAVRLTDAAEWKRRQSVPGVRVTPKAFGKDRRLPITSRYRG